MNAHYPRSRRRRRNGHSLNRLIPNMVTLLALCIGLSAIYFALEGKFRLSVAAVILAAVLDGFDGRIARLLGATSRFGAELDSLSDFVCFGVVPGVLLYLWLLHDVGRLGWGGVLIFAVCAALRLARFNTALDGEGGQEVSRPAGYENFFVGVPAPAGAMLALMPMIASFAMPTKEPLLILPVLMPPLLVGGWIILIAGLMVSRLPTFALKRLHVPNAAVLPLLLGVAVFTSGLIAIPWLMMLASGIGYLGSIPIASRTAARRLRNEPPPPPETPAPSSSPTP